MNLETPLPDQEALTLEDEREGKLRVVERPEDRRFYHQRKRGE